MKKNIIILGVVALILIALILSVIQIIQTQESNRQEVSTCGEGTVIYENEDLCWQQSTMPEQAENWQDAFDYCDNLILADKENWALPTAEELNQIVDKTQVGNTVNPLYFKDTGAAPYWTSTLGQYENSHEYINFNSGFQGTGMDFTKGYGVRCVRVRGIIG